MNKKEYVLGFLFDSARRKVWLIRKNRPAWQSGRLNGIGGKIEHGESPLDAMVREFAEETGVKIMANKWGLFCVMEGGDWKVHCYTSSGDYILESKTDEIVGQYYTDLLTHQFMLPNLSWLLPLALDPESPVASVVQ